MPRSKPKSSRLKPSELRAQGLRPMEFWVPDVHAPSFKAEAHRQSLTVAAGAEAAEDQAFIDAVSDWGRARAKR